MELNYEVHSKQYLMGTYYIFPKMSEKKVQATDLFGQFRNKTVAYKIMSEFDTDGKH